MGTRIENKDLDAKPKQAIVSTKDNKDTEKKKSDSGLIDTVKHRKQDTTASNRDDDSHTDEEIEADDNGIEEESEEKTPVHDEGPAGVQRRSKRDRKPPKRLEMYYTHQITSRPVDRRLQTLQMLLGSGVLDELDSDMTHNILGAVMK